jgi:hypothetical protein
MPLDNSNPWWAAVSVAASIVHGRRNVVPLRLASMGCI